MMNFPNLISLSRRASRLAKSTAIAAAMSVMTACACVSSFLRTAHSPLPIETLDATGGEIASARAFETSDRLYVAGSMRKHAGYHALSPAHVDVQLLDAQGRVLAEQQDDIDLAHPRTASGRIGKSDYVASFPLELARQAASIRVSYHLKSHPVRSTGASSC
jgi:hypothetical protein